MDVPACYLETGGSYLQSWTCLSTPLCLGLSCLILEVPTTYHLLDRAVVLDKVMRQAGQDADQELFRDLLLRLRNGESSVGDWKQLMKRTPAEVGNVSSYDAALGLRLYPTLEAVAEYNAIKLRSNGQPVAIKPVHTGPDASKATHDDAGGTDPVVFLSRGARVMLCANIWVEVGLVNVPSVLDVRFVTVKLSTGLACFTMLLDIFSYPWPVKVGFYVGFCLLGAKVP